MASLELIKVISDPKAGSKHELYINMDHIRSIHFDGLVRDGKKIYSLFDS